LTTLEGERDGFSGQKSDLDKATAGGEAEYKIAQWKTSKDEFALLNEKIATADDAEA